MIQLLICIVFMTHNEKSQHEIADFKKQLCVRVDISSDVSLLLHWSLNWCQVRSGHPGKMLYACWVSFDRNCRPVNTYKDSSCFVMNLKYHFFPKLSCNMHFYANCLCYKTLHIVKIFIISTFSNLEFYISISAETLLFAVSDAISGRAE